MGRMSGTSQAHGPAPQVQPLRAAWVAGDETFDQYARILQPLAVGLMDEMVDVVILCPDPAEAETLAGVRSDVVRCPEARWWGVRGGAVQELAGQLRKRRVRLLHALDASAARLARALARAAGLPYLLSSYALDDARRLGDAARHAAGVLAASEPVRQGLLEQDACPAEKLRLLRPGVYHVRHPTCFHDPDHSVAIVTGGPLDHFQAFDAVLQCFAELVLRKFDCVFFLIGSGRAERRLRDRAEQLHLAGQLTFADCHPLGQLTGIFKAADVYVSPVPQRAIDVRSLLAMAAGVPVLAAAGGGANDFLRDGQTAMAFSPGDAAELTVKLTAMLDDHASARALAASAIEYIHENHSPAVQVVSLAHFYRRLVGEAGEQG
jgi:glycosyltransferase involved in cell wall biosynthesis